MGRHSGAVSRPSDADARVHGGRGQAEVDRAHAPVTDPLLLDAVEQEIRRARQMEAGTPIRLRPPQGRGPHPEPRSNLGPSPLVDRLTESPGIDEAAAPARPRSAPVGTRMPLEYSEDDTSAPAAYSVAFTAEQRLLPMNAEPEPLPPPMPLEFTDPVPGPPGAATTPIAPAPAMRVGDEHDDDAVRLEKASGSIAFGIVVGAAIVAVLTIVAILPF